MPWNYKLRTTSSHCFLTAAAMVVAAAVRIKSVNWAVCGIFQTRNASSGIWCVRRQFYDSPSKDHPNTYKCMKWFGVAVATFFNRIGTKNFVDHFPYCCNHISESNTFDSAVRQIKSFSISISDVLIWIRTWSNAVGHQQQKLKKELQRPPNRCRRFNEISIHRRPFSSSSSSSLVLLLVRRCHSNRTTIYWTPTPTTFNTVIMIERNEFKWLQHLEAKTKQKCEIWRNLNAATTTTKKRTDSAV